MKRIIVFLVCVLPLWLNAEPLSLATCQKMALQQNKQIQAAKSGEAAAQAKRRAAFTQFLPALDFVGTYQRLEDPLQISTPDLQLPVADAAGNIVFTQDSEGNTIVKNWAVLPSQDLTLGETNNFALSLNLRQPLFTGGKIVQQYKMHQLAEKMAQAQRNLTEQTVLYEVEELYWETVSLQEKCRLAERYEAALAQHLHDVQRFYEEGLVTRNVLLKVQVKHNEAQLKKLMATNGSRLAQMALCQKVGLPINSQWELSDSLLIGESETLSGSLETAYRFRPELQLLQNAEKMARAEKKIAFARYLPNLFVTGDFHWLNPNPYNSFDDEFGDSWTVGVVCQWELFHWNERGFQRKAAQHHVDLLHAQWEEAREKMALEMEQIRQRAQEAEQRIEMTTLNCQQAEENLRVTEAQFKEGVVSSAEVLDAQTLWQDAVSASIDARSEYQLQQTAWKKALGLLLLEQGE